MLEIETLTAFVDENIKLSGSRMKALRASWKQFKKIPGEVSGHIRAQARLAKLSPTERKEVTEGMNAFEDMLKQELKKYLKRGARTAGGVVMNRAARPITALIPKIGVDKLAMTKWKEMLLTGNIRREAGRLAPLLNKFKKRYTAGLMRGNKALVKRLGVKLHPSGGDWSTDMRGRHIYFPRRTWGPKKSPVERASAASALRHELDEAREVLRDPYPVTPWAAKRWVDPKVLEQTKHRLSRISSWLSKTKRPKTIPMAVARNQTIAAQDIAKGWPTGAHASPEILRRESVHMTFMPSNIRRYMTRIRKRSGELDALRQGGVRYGKTAPLKPKEIKAFEAGVGRSKMKPEVHKMRADARRLEHDIERIRLQKTYGSSPSLLKERLDLFERTGITGL